MPKRFILSLLLASACAAQQALVPSIPPRSKDTDSSNLLFWKAGSDLSANRDFTLTTGDANRTLTLSGDVSLNQDLLTSSGPTFANLGTTPVLGSTVRIVGATGCQYSTIAAAISAASSGDLIWVMPGTYTSPVLTLPDGVSLGSQDALRTSLSPDGTVQTTDNFITLSGNNTVFGMDISRSDSTSYLIVCSTNSKTYRLLNCRIGGGSDGIIIPSATGCTLFVENNYFYNPLWDCIACFTDNTTAVIRNNVVRGAHTNAGAINFLFTGGDNTVAYVIGNDDGSTNATSGTGQRFITTSASGNDSALTTIHSYYNRIAISTTSGTTPVSCFSLGRTNAKYSTALTSAWDYQAIAGSVTLKDVIYGAVGTPANAGSITLIGSNFSRYTNVGSANQPTLTHSSITGSLVTTATSGKILVSDGSNYVASTPTFPNASATSGKIIKSDGTNWTASTETYAAPGTAGNLLKSDGTNWTSAANTTSIGFTIDGGGVAIATGEKSFIRVPYGGTITAWEIVAEPSGSIVVDIWKDTGANFPPTVADTITASDKPTLSSASRATGSCTGWTTSLTTGDYLKIKVDSATTVTKVFLNLSMTRN